MKAQGIGNIISGLIGGLPITQVIVRSSANVAFGAKTKLSTIFHGIVLLASVIAIPDILNMVPLASLACILIVVGYKLAKPAIFKKSYKLGLEQFVPFVMTICGMVFFDLLSGIGLGMLVAIYYLLYNNFKNSYHRIRDEEGRDNKHVIKLAEEVSFLNKGSIIQMLTNLRDGSELVIDGSRCKTIRHDVIEIIRDFRVNARSRNIALEIRGIEL